MFNEVTLGWRLFFGLSFGWRVRLKSLDAWDLQCPWGHTTTTCKWFIHGIFWITAFTISILLSFCLQIFCICCVKVLVLKYQMGKSTLRLQLCLFADIISTTNRCKHVCVYLVYFDVRKVFAKFNFLSERLIFLRNVAITGFWTLLLFSFSYYACCACVVVDYLYLLDNVANVIIQYL